MTSSVFDFSVEPERYELFANPNFLRELTRRDFFRIAGAGLVVALLLHDELDAQQRPAQRRRRGFGPPLPKEIAAWLHIGEDSLVTVFTGKVELGQNIRTSLTQVVAEELQVPPAQVRLVMADTQQTPFDMGTFGSMTTPVMAAHLRLVAATARELLLDMAAKASSTERGSLRIKEGKIVGADSKPSYKLGELAQGKKLVKLVDEKVSTTPAEKWTIAGTSLPKVDGRAFVTGGHAYSSDVRRPGMLHGKVLRPPTFRATLVSVDTRQAESMPGVTLVHDGDFIAVAAPNEQLADKALDLVKAEWKSQPQPSGAELFKLLKSSPAEARDFGFRSSDKSGSVSDAMAAADLKLDATYTIAYIAHAPLEPRAAVAEWSDGKLTVWTGTQRPFGVRADLASALKLPNERVHVIVPDTGSGYGGKHTGEAALEAARLAKAAGKPVKVVWTREEEFTWAYFRPAGVIDVRAGVKKDGTLTAWEFHNYNSGGAAIRTPYEVANRQIQFHGAELVLRQGSYRALAATANHFARETHMDELAHALHMDALAFRLKNLKDDRLRAVLEAAANGFGWNRAKPAANHGVGIAGGTEKGSYVATCAEVFVEPTSGKVKVTRIMTAFECGAVLNPDHLKNQVEGACVMGLGGALFEAVRFNNGKILNPRFSSYRVPRFSDTPPVDVVLLDRKDLPSAGAGETAIVALAPALGNAIFQATGVRLRSMPMAPKGVKAAQQTAENRP
jgi:isoquinoline 1-oxidoreductase